MNHGKENRSTRTRLDVPLHQGQLPLRSLHLQDLQLLMLAMAAAQEYGAAVTLHLPQRDDISGGLIRSRSPRRSGAL